MSGHKKFKRRKVIARAHVCVCLLLTKPNTTQHSELLNWDILRETNDRGTRGGNKLAENKNALEPLSSPRYCCCVLYPLAKRPGSCVPTATLDLAGLPIFTMREKEQKEGAIWSESSLARKTANPYFHNVSPTHLHRIGVLEETTLGQCVHYSSSIHLIFSSISPSAEFPKITLT